MRTCILTRLIGMIILHCIQILNHYVAHLKLIWASLLAQLKESTCNAGDPVWFLGREDSRYPLQYSWASLVVQMVKNLPAMQETWVRSLDWEDPLEKGMATHSSILAWRIPWTEEPGGLQSIMGSQTVGHNWVTKHSSASNMTFSSKVRSSWDT